VTSQSGGVLCTGNLVVDILVRPVDEIPWGKTAQVEAIEEHSGGNGCSTSYTLGMLGTRVRLLGAVGNDSFGDFLVERLRGAGVEISGLRRTAAATATSVAIVARDGARGFLHRRGASAEMYVSAEEFDAGLAGGFQHYHMAGPYTLTRMRAVHPELIRRARAAGLSTSIDTQWDSQGKWLEDLEPSLPSTGILFVNEDEARMLSGSADPDVAARLLRERGACTVVVKLGGRGCAIYTGSGKMTVPAFAVPVVDTTGAGDCFVGGFLSEMLRGRTLEEAARFANAVAAMSVGSLGVTTGVAPRTETEAWIRKQPRP
jgi:sugar/nucleoside kinase (ribokinase family)